MDPGCLLVPSHCYPEGFSRGQVTYYHAVRHLHLVASGVRLAPFPFSYQDEILLVSKRIIRVAFHPFHLKVWMGLTFYIVLVTYHRVYADVLLPD